MGKILGVHYYNEDNGLLVLKWNESEGKESYNEDFKYFIAPYIKDIKLTCLLDDESDEMIKYSFYDEGKKMIEPVLALPVDDDDCISTGNRKSICIGLNATLQTILYNSCEHTFDIIKQVCEILLNNGIVPKDVRKYFDILNSFDYYFISEAKLSEEDKQKVLSIMACCPNEKEQFLDRAFSEQEDLRGSEHYSCTQLPYIYNKK